MSSRSIFVRLRVYSVLNSIPPKIKNQTINNYLRIVKQSNLNIYTLFYYIDTIQSNLTYILFYSVLYYKNIVSKILSK